MSHFYLPFSVYLWKYSITCDSFWKNQISLNNFEYVKLRQMNKHDTHAPFKIKYNSIETVKWYKTIIIILFIFTIHEEEGGKFTHICSVNCLIHYTIYMIYKYKK